MNLYTRLAAALLISGTLVGTAHAANKYWDINGINTGATDTGDATGTWDGVTANWNTTSTGITTATTTWASGDTAIFSAGTNATGAFTVTLSGTQTIAGMTFEEGNVTLTGGSLALTGTTDTFNAAVDATIATDISGTSALTKSGVGTLTISGAGSWGGTTTVSAGTLTLTGSNALTGATTVNAGTLNLDYTTNNNNKINAAGLLTLGNGATVNLIGNAGAPTSQTVNGLTLSASGASLIAIAPSAQTVTLNLGALTRGSASVTKFTTTDSANTVITTSSTGTNGIVGGYATFGDNDWAEVSGGSITALGTYSSDFNTIAATQNMDATADAAPAADSSMNSLRFNTGANATVTLAGTTNTITTGGILVTPNVGGSAAAISGADLTSGTSDLVVVQNNTSADFTIGSAITGAGIGLTKAGAGTLVISGNNTAAGSHTVLAGTLKLGAADRIADTAAVNVLTGATFDMNGFNESIGSLAGAGAVTLSGALTVGNATNTTYSGIASGTGSMTKVGTGTLTLSGASTYTGPTNVNAGILSVTSGTGLGAGTTTNTTNTTIADGATLQVSGGITINERIVINGNGSTGTNGALRKTGNNTTELHGQLTGTGSIMVTAGTLRFTQTSTDGSNSGFTGPITATGGSTVRFEFINPNQLGQNNVITLDNGTLRNDNGSVPGNGSMFSSTATMTLGAGGGTLEYNTVGGLSIVNGTSVISGPGGLTKTGAGTVTIASASTYGGPTRVAAGTLRVRTDNERYPNGSALTIDSGATFDVDGLTETMGSLAGAGTLEINAGSFLAGGDNTSTAFTGLITGTGTGTNLTKQGTGTLTLNGTNTYTGNTTISAGAIQIQTNGALGTTAGLTTVSSGAALEIDGSGLAVAEPLTISSTGLTAAPNTGGLRNIANNNTVSGNILLGGAARIQSDAGTLSLTGPGIQATNTTARALTVGGAGNVTISNVIGDPAGANNISTFTKADAGTVTLSGANVYTSTTTISAGTLRLGAAGVIPDGSAVTVTGTLEMNGFNETIGSLAGAGNVNMPGNLTTGGAVALTSTSHSGVIAGAGSLTKIGIGTQSLSGANTYSLGTTVSGGRLHANSATATGTGAVAVNNGAVLAGSGNVVGAITVANTGHLGGGVGLGDGSNLTVNSTVDVQAGGHLDFVMGAPGTLAGDHNNDLVVDAGDYATWRKNPDNHGGDPGGYTAWRGNFGGSGMGVGTADRLKVTTAGGLTLAPGSILTLLGGTTAPSGAYTVLEYNTNYNGTFSSLYINNATGFELGSIVDNTTAKTFDVNITSTVQDRTWIGVGNGNWSANQLADGTNWDDGSQPNGPGAIGRFLATGGGNPAHVVTITDSDKTLGNMILDNTSSYTIAATGPHRLITNTYSGNAAINVVNGNHTISAPVTVNKATDVTVTNGANTLTVSGNVANNSGLTKAGAGNLNVSGVISGTSSLTLATSAGITTLSGANTYSGGTTVNASSTLTLTNIGTTSGTGTGAVTIDGTLNNNGRNTGTTTINTGGIENIAGTATGNHTINSGGTVTVLSGGLASGTHTTNTGGILNVNSGGSAATQTISGGTVNVGGTVTGTSTLTASGVLNVNSGGMAAATTITAGTVNVAGTLTGTATIGATGVLAGTGTTANITDQSGGHLKPGGAGTIGTMTVASANTVNLQLGSHLDIDVNTTSADLLNLTNIGTGTVLTIGSTAAGASVNVNVNVLASLSTGVYTYPIIDFSSLNGAIGGGGFADLITPPPQGGYTFTLVNNTGNSSIDLQIAVAGAGAGAGTIVSGSSLDSSAVPEPTAAGLLALGMAGLTLRRRGRPVRKLRFASSGWPVSRV